VSAAEEPVDFDVGGFAFANMLEILEDWRRTVDDLVDPDFFDASDVGLPAVVPEGELLASFSFSFFAAAALGAALEEVAMDIGAVV